MSNLGSWKIDDLLTWSVNTHTPSTGAGADADAVPAYRVYEDETATPILTGNMALLDSVNTVGLYSEQITLSAANGFEKGKSYNIYVSAAVGGVTGTISHNLQMEAEVDANVVSDKTDYSVGTGGIVAGSFAAGAVDATAIATDAIGAAELATDAVNEIRDAILADSTAFNGADIATILSDTDDIQLRLPSALTTGAADSGSTTTMVDAVRAEADTDYWKGMAIRFTSGTIADQVRLITGFAPGTDTITFAPATTQAVATNTYEILPWSAVDARLWNGSAPNNLVSGAVDADVSAVQANAITASAIATDAIGAAELATDGVNEIRDAVTGGAYALDTDANGRLRVVDGTAAGEIDTVSGRVQVTEAQIDQVVDETWDEVLSGATHNVASSSGRRLRQLQESRYEGGSVWIDTVNGAAGTADFENGTVQNPVDNIADANTIATSIGLSRFQVTPGSSITFATAQQGQSFLGHGWTLALGGQDIANTSILGATVSGTGTGTGTQFFISCVMNAVTLPSDTHVVTSSIAGTQTLVAGDFFYDRDYSGIAGTGAPIWDFGAAILNTNLNVRNYSGGVHVQNMGNAGTDNASIEGRGQVIINANSTGGTMVIRGLFNLTDNGAVTITRSAMFQHGVDLDSILADTNELQADWANAGRLDSILDARASQATADAIEADTQDIQGRLPAVLVSGKMDSDMEAISGSTLAADKLEASALTIIAAAAAAGTLSTTQMTTDLTEATDDHYNGRIIIWTSGALIGQASDITDYAGSNFMLTYTAITEAPIATDTFIIV